MSKPINAGEMARLENVVHDKLCGAHLLTAERWRESETEFIVLWADGHSRAGTHRAALRDGSKLGPEHADDFVVYGSYFDGRHAILRAVEDFVDRAKLKEKA